MNEFEIVQHTGGKIKVHASKNSIGFEHRSDHAASVFQLGYSPIDQTISYVPLGGIGTNNLPIGSVPIFMFSDREGFFGRSCPECKGYFRVDSGGEEFYCPYCSLKDSTLSFTTANQYEYIGVYLQTIITALHNKVDIEIDLDDIIANLPDNTTSFVYSEERQQKHNKCKLCKTRYDILGEFGCCPNCGKLNTFEVFNDNLSCLIERINNSASTEGGQEFQSNACSDVLKSCISEFEAMAKDIRDELLRLPATPNRKEEIKKISFQRLLFANECLNNWFGIDFLKGISDEDKGFIDRCYHRRHILMHNSGVVDEKYIKNTNDTSVRLNQKIRIEKDEAFKFINLTRAISKKLFDGFESIS